MHSRVMVRQVVVGCGFWLPVVFGVWWRLGLVVCVVWEFGRDGDEVRRYVSVWFVLYMAEL